MPSHDFTVFITPTACVQISGRCDPDKLCTPASCLRWLKCFTDPQISDAAEVLGEAAAICEIKEQMGKATRRIWRRRGTCPVRQGADDAESGVFLVSCFIYQTRRAAISLEHQNMQTAGRQLRRAGRGEELGALCCSSKDSTTCEAPCPEGQRQDAFQRAPHALFSSPLHPARGTQALISTQPNVSRSQQLVSICTSHPGNLSATMTSPSQVRQNHFFFG